MVLGCLLHLFACGASTGEKERIVVQKPDNDDQLQNTDYPIGEMNGVECRRNAITDQRG